MIDLMISDISMDNLCDRHDLLESRQDSTNVDIQCHWRGPRVSCLAFKKLSLLQGLMKNH